MTSCSAGSEVNTQQSATSLSEALGGAVFLDPEQAAALQEQRQIEVDVLTTECMASFGFDWLPDPKVPTIRTGPDDDLDFGSIEWTSKYGFGISTQFFPQSQLPPSLVGLSEEPDLSNWTSPAAEIRQALSESEREAYDAALGGNPEIPGDTGCRELAYNLAFQNDPAIAVYEALGAPLAELGNRVLADHRVIEHQEEIRSCMSEAGMAIFTSEDAYQERLAIALEELVEELLSDIDADRNASAGTAEPPVATAQEPKQVKLSDQQLERLTAIQIEEVAVATQLRVCGGGPEAEEFLTLIEDEYEAEFVEENSALLRDLRDQITE